MLCSPYCLLQCIFLGIKNTEASDSFSRLCHQECFNGVLESLQETKANKNIPSFKDKGKGHQFKHFCISEHAFQTIDPPGTILLSLTLDGILWATRA